ncbi:MAG: hypothetical protein LUH02_03300, partial [Erysipelotrichaceae bacterium]|nr:hypothetical protein [Erysipelotrichaceae bacterium]
LSGTKINLDRNAVAIHYPHQKRNNIEDWDKFISNIIKQREYIYQKYPLPEVKAWINHPSSDTFNQYLINSLKL